MIIYKITNTVNGKIYIGQTVQTNPKMRWYSHQADARKGKKSHLYDSMRKHGVESFAWEVIDQADNLEALNKLEQHYVELYDSINKGYNVREAGGNKLHNAASIEKMRASQKAAHARRRANGGDGGWTRIDGGAMKGKSHPRKGTTGLWTMTDEAKARLSKIAKEKQAHLRFKQVKEN